MAVAKRKPITTFTAVLRYPCEPARYFKKEIARSTRPPATLTLPSFIDPSGKLDTFVLVGALSWPTVAIYALEGTEIGAQDTPSSL